MRKLLLGAVAIFSWFSVYPALAAPTCTNTMTATSGSPIAGSFLVTSGNCVLAGDKVFGNFTVGGVITAAGSGTFTFASPMSNVTLGFLGSSVTPGTTGTIGYEVEIDTALAGGNLIHNLEKDFTFNQAQTGAGATATLSATTSVAPESFLGGDITTGFQCTRSISATGTSASTCPQTGLFSPFISDLVVDETISAGANANVTALTDTISQAVPGVPEPASLAMLGTALVMLGMVGTRRRRSDC